jgi:hypothetical protein
VHSRIEGCYVRPQGTPFRPPWADMRSLSDLMSRISREVASVQASFYCHGRREGRGNVLNLPKQLIRKSPERPRRVRSIVRGVVPIVVPMALLGLTGCAEATHSPEVSPTSHHSAESTPTPTHTAIGPISIVATGELSSIDGKTAGKVTVEIAGENVLLSVNGFRTTNTGPLQLDLSPWDVSTKCLADSQNQVVAKTGGTSLRDLTVGLARNNPSYFRALVLTRPEDATASSSNECRMKTLAIAPLSWKFPDPRPDLKPNDSGAGPGALGAVSLESGLPGSYVVVQDDTLSAIAARFGITVDDLTYLNPLDTKPLWPGQQLNLSKDRRGATL